MFLKVNKEESWPCCACKVEVSREEVIVHHLDEDHNNNVIENLAPMHFGCHSRHHRLGKKQSQETVTKRANKHKGMKRSEDTKAKMQEAAARRPVTQAVLEGRRKMAEKQRERWKQGLYRSRGKD